MTTFRTLPGDAAGNSEQNTIHESQDVMYRNRRELPADHKSECTQPAETKVL